MARDTRQKASDVFRETNFVFGNKVSFVEAFPQIEDIEVEVIEEDMIHPEKSYHYHYIKNNLP